MRLTVWTLLCWLFYPIIPFAQTDWSQAVVGLEKRVVRIEILTKDADADTPNVCSGAVLHQRAGYVVTCQHCIDGDVTAITVSGRHAEVVRQNKLLDVAVVRTELKDAENITLATHAPIVGSDIAILGYSFGAKRLHMQFGRVSLPLDDDGRLVIDGMAIGGNSGGPAVNARGELVGLTSYVRARGPMHLAYMVPVEQVREFVDTYLPSTP